MKSRSSVQTAHISEPLEPSESFDAVPSQHSHSAQHSLSGQRREETNQASDVGPNAAEASAPPNQLSNNPHSSDKRLPPSRVRSRAPLSVDSGQKQKNLGNDADPTYVIGAIFPSGGRACDSLLDLKRSGINHTLLASNPPLVLPKEYHTEPELSSVEHTASVTKRQLIIAGIILATTVLLPLSSFLRCLVVLCLLGFFLYRKPSLREEPQADEHAKQREELAEEHQTVVRIQVSPKDVQEAVRRLKEFTRLRMTIVQSR